MNDRYQILTPEKVVLTVELANLGPRIIAHIIDLFLMFIGLVVGLVAISQTAIIVGEGLSGLVATVFATFFIFIYLIASEIFLKGQTVGKKLLGLRVVTVDGRPLTSSSAFLRNVLRIADLLPGTYLLGLVTMFLNERSQRLGDLMAGTIVVRVAPAFRGFTAAPHHAGVHQLEHSIGDVGQMTLEEYAALKRLCDRFPYLTTEAQAWSLQQVWEPFRERLGIISVDAIHPIYQIEAVVMKYGRLKKLV